MTELTTPAGDAVREKYRNEGRSEGRLAERTYIMLLIKNQVCFDALMDHDAVAEQRTKYPALVGRCSNHGGKCSELLSLLHEMNMGRK